MTLPDNDPFRDLHLWRMAVQDQPIIFYILYTTSQAKWT